MAVRNETASPQNTKRLILLVDDDPALRRLFGGRLFRLGYEVIYANDGNEGREVARRMQPHAVILDYNMPVMDGMETAGRLRAEQETKHIPIILLTNEDLSVEAEKAIREIGISAYVHKGEDIRILRERLREVLSSRATPASY